MTQPVSFPDNFPDETFYQLAQSTITLPGGATAVLNDNLEAAFNTATPQAGQQITFGRVTTGGNPGMHGQQCRLTTARFRRRVAQRLQVAN